MMHVLVMPSWFPTDENPIRGSFFVEQASMLANAGHQVGMLVPPSILRTRHGVREVSQNFSSRQRVSIDLVLGIPTRRLKWWGVRGTVNPYWRPSVIDRTFGDYCRSEGTPDVLHAHSALYAGFVATELGKNHGIPTLITEHSTKFLRPFSPIHTGHRRIVERTLRHATRLSAVSRPLADALSRFTDRDIDVVPNPVDTNLFHPSHEAPESLTITTIGSLIERKGHSVLLEAFALMGLPSARLRIVGDGPLRNQIEQQATNLHIRDQCEIVGALHRSAIPAIINDSHIVVSASDAETFGVTLIEALACGRPVVATRSGGPEDIISDGLGILVDRNDPIQLAGALHDIWTNYGDYDTQAIRSRCVESFSQAAVVSRTVAQYEAAQTEAASLP